MAITADLAGFGRIPAEAGKVTFRRKPDEQICGGYPVDDFPGARDEAHELFKHYGFDVTHFTDKDYKSSFTVFS